MQAVPAQLPPQKPIIFRIFYATDQKTGEYFRAHLNKILNGLRGKSYSGLIVVVQSFMPNGTENPCVARSIPVLATISLAGECRNIAVALNCLKSPRLGCQK